MEILKIKDLNFTYPNEKSMALQHVSFSVEKGEFVLICGESGCGKTTLLKMIKPQITPHGNMTGNIYFDGINLKEIPIKKSTGEIGYITQNPADQISMAKVWHELAFGLENLGYPAETIRIRVAEIANYFGIHHWFHEKTNALSGGQKQMLSLASIMTMQPEILILDEPTSQLDPITAEELITTLHKLNKDLGLTILMVEHRLEEVFSIADKVGIMEKGSIQIYGKPEDVINEISTHYKDHKMIKAFPSAVKIFLGLKQQGVCPMTVKDGRKFLDKYYTNEINSLVEEEDNIQEADKFEIDLKNIWFRYEKQLPDILSGLNLRVKKGEIFFILGANGCGKTTLLQVISGQNKFYRGTLKINGKKIRDYKKTELYRQNIALLPQNPQTVFLKSSLMEDYYDISKAIGYGKEETRGYIDVISHRLGISHILNKHPYDLSGGEQQKAALGKILLLKPKIILLDEPTKGIDAFAKDNLSKELKYLESTGITIVIVTHDIEFAALNADRCGLFFDGKILSVNVPREFFSGNSYYTTVANRISKHHFKDAITCEDVIKLCQLNKEKLAYKKD